MSTPGLYEHKLSAPVCHYCHGDLARIKLNRFECLKHLCPVHMRFDLTDLHFKTIAVSLVVPHKLKNYEMYMVPVKRHLFVYELEWSVNEGTWIRVNDGNNIYSTDECPEITPDNAEHKLATILTFL